MWDHIIFVLEHIDNIIVVSHKLFRITACHHYSPVSMPGADEDRGNLAVLLNSLAVAFIHSVLYLAEHSSDDG